VLIGTVALAIWASCSVMICFRADAPWLAARRAVGGAMVALFEIAYQFAIGGVGVAWSGSTALYRSRHRCRPGSGDSEGSVDAGRAWLSHHRHGRSRPYGHRGQQCRSEAARMGVSAGIAAALSAVSYALTSLMGRYAAPRYGVVKVLFLEAIGGVLLIWIALAIWGRSPQLLLPQPHGAVCLDSPPAP